jgi:hypothetical protein
VSAQNPTDPIGGGFTPEEIAARLELIQYTGQTPCSWQAGGIRGSLQAPAAYVATWDR